MPNPFSHNSPASSHRWALLALIAAACSMSMQAAPTVPVSAATKPVPAKTAHVAVHKSAHPHKHTPPPPPQVAVSSPIPAVPVAPPTPPLPVWPVNEAAVRASVSWDSSRGLKISAANSSLQQILTDVASLTSVAIDGLGADQRVFGDFGPGPVRDILSQLLLGSGYNVLMSGDLGQGTPRQILLSVPNSTGTTPNSAPASAVDEDADVPEPTPPPMQQQPMARPGFMARGARNPQQLEWQRQQDLQQQQQGRPPQ